MGGVWAYVGFFLALQLPGTGSSTGTLGPGQVPLQSMSFILVVILARRLPQGVQNMEGGCRYGVGGGRWVGFWHMLASFWLSSCLLQALQQAP